MTAADLKLIEEVEAHEKFCELEIVDRIIHKLLMANLFENDEQHKGAKLAVNYLQEERAIIIEEWSPSRCPTCEEEFDEECNDGYYKHEYIEMCPHCGQKLKWND